MILVDTSVWIQHLRKADARLRDLLERDLVATHPLVIGELAMGSLRSRDEFIGILSLLDTFPIARHDEVLTLVDTHGLSGKGLGWIDAHLLASVLLGGGRLWTLDRRLRAAATQLRLAASFA